MCIHSVTSPWSDSNWFHVWLESPASVVLSSAFVIVNPTPKRLFLQHRKSFEKSDEGKSLITRSTLPSVYISGIIMGLKRNVRLFWILPSARLCMIAFNFSPPSDAMNWKILEHMLRHTSSLQLLVNTFGKREKTVLFSILLWLAYFLREAHKKRSENDSTNRW